MPDYDDDDQAQHNRDGFEQRKLEEALKAKQEAEAAIAAANEATRAAQRELAFARAGVDTNSPLGQLFAKAYDGENDVDLVKSEWAKLQPGAEGRPQVSAEEQAAMQRISQAQAGSVPSGGQVHDFQAQLDAIPMYVNGQQNFDYVNQVLAATREQAAREGRQFSVEQGSNLTWTNGSGPVTNPL